MVENNNKNENDVVSGTDTDTQIAESSTETENQQSNNVQSDEDAPRNEIVESTNEDPSDISVTNTDEEEEFVYVPKLTEAQQKLWQTIAGIGSGFLIWWSLWMGSVDPDNGLFRWLFLIIFVVIMLIKRQIEVKTGIILKTFQKFFLIGLVVFLGVFVLEGIVTGKFAAQA